MNISACAKSLPNLLTFTDGRPVQTAADWRLRRAELLDTVLAIEYGHLPPTPTSVDAYPLHACQTQSGIAGGHYRLTMQPSGFEFTVTVYKPKGGGPFPAVVDGDGCWDYLTDEVISEVVRHGVVLACFSRVEIVPDNLSSARDTGLHLVHPGGDYGALSAWAWGYHRVVDALATMPEVDATRLIATGHSRGGKAALLAGATDERFALTAPNNSGCGGAGCFHFPDDGGETLDHFSRNFSYWFTPRLFDYVGRPAELPFDQHSVKALIAPRALLTTEALGDIWASPRGTFITHAAAREVYDFLDASESIGVWYRDGGHAHALEDWRTLLDFADARLDGKPAGRNYHAGPWEAK